MNKIFEKVNEIGWLNLLPRGSRWVKRLLDENYRNIFLRSTLVTRLFPFHQPPILLLSYPRSGSSWAGVVLSRSKNLTYSFEPVTRPYQKYQAGQAMVDLTDPAVYQLYLQYSQDAFQGKPPKEWDGSENPADFSLFGRKQRQLFIKEVNPRATELYCTYFQPIILFLVRHPAAVALSFWEQGWLASPDVHQDISDQPGDDWEKFGYAYGLSLKNALETIERFEIAHQTVFYEPLAHDPFGEFQKIFTYLGVTPPENYAEIIDEFCLSGTGIQGYETRRVSRMMIEKWKEKLSPDQMINVRRGYQRSGFRYYQSEHDWELDVSD